MKKKINKSQTTIILIFVIRIELDFICGLDAGINDGYATYTIHIKLSFSFCPNHNVFLIVKDCENFKENC